MKRVVLLYRYIATIVVLGVILYLSLDPNPVPRSHRFFYFPGIDKVVHALMYMGLTMVFCADYFRNALMRYETRVLWWAFAVATAIGGVIELLQWQMHLGRSGEWADLLADAAGAALGIGIGVWLIKPAIMRWKGQKEA